MSEEGAHTVGLAHAETLTHTSACSTHTGGPMQLQASTDTEEKKVSTLNAWSFLLVFDSSPNRVLIWAQLKSTVELCASKAVSIWHSADLIVTARVVPPRVTVQYIPHCWN